MSWVLVEGLWCRGSRLLLGCWQPRLHEAVSEVDLIEVDLGQGGDGAGPGEVEEVLGQHGDVGTQSVSLNTDVFYQN